jgi:pimeloyl-ACP methyl ester carboxylesterase
VAALQLEGHVVVAPDWDSGAADRGAGVLTASLDQAVALTGVRQEVPLVVVGWSLGGKAALSLALDPGHAARVSAVVGLAAGTRGPSPVDGSEPLARVREGLDHGPPPIYLVHGRGDTSRPPRMPRSSHWRAAAWVSRVP